MASADPSPSYLAVHDALCGVLLVAAKRGGADRPRNYESILRLCPPLTESFVTEHDMFLAASELQELGLIEIFGADGVEADLSPGTSIGQLMITAHGLEEFGKPATRVGKAARRFTKLDDDEITGELEDIYQSIDRLEPLRYRRAAGSIDLRGTPELARLEERLDHLLVLIAGNNQLAAAASPETSAAIERVKEGRALVRAGVFSVRKIELLLYGALGYLATKFIDVPIGEAAEAAWTALRVATSAFIGM